MILRRIVRYLSHLANPQRQDSGDEVATAGELAPSRLSLLRLRLDQSLQLLAIDEGASISPPSVPIEQAFTEPAVERRLADLELAHGVVGGDQVRHVRSVGEQA
jgi:hypothetical protein